MSRRHPDYPRDRPTVPEVLTLLEAYMSRDENIIGGALKLFLDGNYTNGNIAWLRADAWENKDCAAVAIIDKLAQMTRTQRDRVCLNAGYPLLAIPRATMIKAPVV